MPGIVYMYKPDVIPLNPLTVLNLVLATTTTVHYDDDDSGDGGEHEGNNNKIF